MARAETEKDAMDALTSHGYYDIVRLMQHGHSWHGTAKNADKVEVQVMIDGNGGVHEKAPDQDSPDKVVPPDEPPAPDASGTEPAA